MMKAVPFETLKDAEGSVSLGWAGYSVAYAVVVGGFSAALGVRFANQLETLVSTETNVHYFADLSQMVRYDLLARSAFVRMVLANRRRFDSFTLLTWSEGMSRAAQTFAEALGGTVTLCTEVEEFERRLLVEAPLARQRLNPAVWQRFESTSRPAR
jgi:hypothetical protein